MSCSEHMGMLAIIMPDICTTILYQMQHGNKRGSHGNELKIPLVSIEGERVASFSLVWSRAKCLLLRQPQTEAPRSEPGKKAHMHE